MVGTIASVVDRRRALGLSVLYMLSTSVVASLVGALAGAVGGAFGLAPHLGAAWQSATIALALLLALAIDLRVLRVPTLYCRRQVQSGWWAEGRQVRTVVLWGLQLGVGPLTYLPSSAYYALLWMCAVMGPALGGGLMAIYGLSRGVHPLIVALGSSAVKRTAFDVPSATHWLHASLVLVAVLVALSALM